MARTLSRLVLCSCAVFILLNFVKDVNKLSTCFSKTCILKREMYEYVYVLNQCSGCLNMHVIRNIVCSKYFPCKMSYMWIYICICFQLLLRLLWIVYVHNGLYLYFETECRSTDICFIFVRYLYIIFYRLRQSYRWTELVSHLILVYDISSPKWTYFGRVAVWLS